MATALITAGLQTDAAIELYVAGFGGYPIPPSSAQGKACSAACANFKWVTGARYCLRLTLSSVVKQSQSRTAASAAEVAMTLTRRPLQVA